MRKIWSALGAGLLVAGFATGAIAASQPTYRPVPAGAISAFTSSDVVLTVEQDEIEVVMPESQSDGQWRGLFWLAVESIEEQSREDVATTPLKPLKAALADYRFEVVLGETIQSRLSEIAWLGPVGVQTVKSRRRAASATADSKASAVIEISSSYRLSPRGDVLLVTASVLLRANSDALRAAILEFDPGRLKERRDVLYQNTLVFEADAPNASGNREHNAAIWSANGGEQMRLKLKMAADKLMTMLGYDFQAGAETSLGVITIDGIAGNIVKRDNDGAIVRLRGGKLKYATNEVLKS